ncbi:Deoxyribonuclease TatD-related protein [Neofusicoccum parvum]|uniref:Deoxyribonuclease TatD-related protein n=2 Tax=Neofusicoccum parvum TaxID=310453 RepID=A0ACB5S221_9PEZI|nr:Deoxyribonuclease TatD-related protein [Neofusicoccum parvum]
MSTSAPGSDAALNAQDGVQEQQKKLRYADIGINLGDPIFRGVYHGKQAHEDDFDGVLERALAAGCEKMMVTGSDLKESEHAVQIAKEHPGLCYATVGVHPCSAKQFDTHPGGPDALLASLRALAASSAATGHTVAFGEIGLDYDRLFLTPKDQQLRHFEAQLDLAVELQLPLFLHSRAAAADFSRLLGARLPRLPRRGLVHSFTGSLEEMRELVALGLDVGVNGCSLKTEENVAVVREIPLDRLQIETDGPWCEMRPSHASAKFLKEVADSLPQMPKAVKKERWAKGCMVKGRNEPATIPLVAHVVARIKGVSVEEVVEAAWNNSVRMFGLGEKVE